MVFHVPPFGSAVSRWVPARVKQKRDRPFGGIGDILFVHWQRFDEAPSRYPVWSARFAVPGIHKAFAGATHSRV